MTQVKCRRCGRKQYAEIDLLIRELLCQFCGESIVSGAELTDTPFDDGQATDEQSWWLFRIAVTLFLIVLVGIPALLAAYVLFPERFDTRVTEFTVRSDLRELRQELPTNLVTEIQLNQATENSETSWGQRIFYSSDGRLLHGEYSAPQGPGPFSVVVLCRGPWSAAADIAASATDFLSAGYAVCVPTYRGEAGNTGNFELARGEVEDVMNCLERLSGLPEIRADRVFLAGEGIGGSIALLAAELSDLPCAVATLDAFGNLKTASDQISTVPFDEAQAAEWKVRSPGPFVPMLRSPILLACSELWLPQVPESRAMAKKSSQVQFKLIDDRPAFFSTCVSFFNQAKSATSAQNVLPPVGSIPAATMQTVDRVVVTDTSNIVAPDNWHLDPDPDPSNEAPLAPLPGRLLSRQTGTLYNGIVGIEQTSEPMEVTFWNLQNGKGHKVKGQLPSLADRTVVSGCSRRGRLFSLQHQSQDGDGFARNILTVHSSQDGRMIRQFDYCDGAQFAGEDRIVTLTRPIGAVDEIANRAPHDQRSGTIRIWDFEQQDPLAVISVDVGHWIVSAGDRYVFLVTPETGPAESNGVQFKVIETATGKQVESATYAVGQQLLQICAAPDGRRVAGWTQFGNIYVWDIVTGQLELSAQTDFSRLRQRPINSFTECWHLRDEHWAPVSWLPDSQHLLVDNCQAINCRTGEVVWTAAENSCRHRGRFLLTVDGTCLGPVPFDRFAAAANALSEQNANDVLAGGRVRFDLEVEGVLESEESAIRKMLSPSLQNWTSCEWDENAKAALSVRYQESLAASLDLREFACQMKGIAVNAKSALGRVRPSLASREVSVECHLITESGKAAFHTQSTESAVPKVIDLDRSLTWQMREASLSRALSRMAPFPTNVIEGPEALHVLPLQLSLVAPDGARQAEPPMQITMPEPGHVLRKAHRLDRLTRVTSISTGVPQRRFQSQTLTGLCIGSSEGDPELKVYASRGCDILSGNLNGKLSYFDKPGDGGAVTRLSVNSAGKLYGLWKGSVVYEPSWRDDVCGTAPGIIDFVLTGDGRHMIVLQRNLLQLWNLETLAESPDFNNPNPHVTGQQRIDEDEPLFVRILEDQRTVVVVGEEHGIQFIDMDTGDVKNQIALPFVPTSFECTLGGDSMFLCLNDRLAMIKQSGQMTEIRKPGFIRPLKLSPNGQFIAVGMPDKGTAIYHSADLQLFSYTGRLKPPERNAYQTFQLAWSPDSQFIASSDGDSINVWRVEWPP